METAQHFLLQERLETGGGDLSPILFSLFLDLNDLEGFLLRGNNLKFWSERI